MAGYIRKTAMAPAAILEAAGPFLSEMLGVECREASAHHARYTGAEGSVDLHVHRHSLYTEVRAETDQLRTSRMDMEVQRFLNQLPYEPGDQGGPGSGNFRVEADGALR